MIEFAKLMAYIISQIDSILFFKAKQYGYTNSMLFIYKNRPNNLPSFTSTSNLNNPTWKEIEENIQKLDLSSDEKYLKQLQEAYRHNGMPMEFNH